MCLQGFAQSGQEQSVSSSREDCGKSGTLAASKASSMFCGISPVSNLATKIACSAIASVTLFQSFGESGLSAILIFLFLLAKLEKNCDIVLLQMCCPSIELGEKEDG